MVSFSESQNLSDKFGNFDLSVITSRYKIIFMLNLQ